MDGLHVFFLVSILIVGVFQTIVIQRWQTMLPRSSAGEDVFSKNQAARTWPIIASNGLNLLMGLILVIYTLYKGFTLKTINISIKILIALLAFVGMGHDIYVAFDMMGTQDCSIYTDVGYQNCVNAFQNRQTIDTIVGVVSTVLRLIVVMYLAYQTNNIVQIAGKRR